MRITDVRTVLLTGPLTHDTSLTTVRKLRSAALIEIETDTEHVGIGETYTGYHAPELVPAIVDFFKPILVGRTEADLDPRDLWRRMYTCGNFWARIGLGANVLAGVEGALWDLLGKLRGKPVHELIAPTVHKQLLCYATGGTSPYPWDNLRRKLESYRTAGFRVTKVATGWRDSVNNSAFWADDPQSWIELERKKLEMVRDWFGSDLGLALDAHMSNDGAAYGHCWDAEIASRVLKSLEDFELVFFEEPLHYNDKRGYAQLCAATSVPVAGGECLTTVQEFADYAELSALDIAQPDAAYIGIGPFVDTAALFAAQGQNVATHAWSAGVGVMQNIHAAFACPNATILEIAPLAGPLHTELWTDGFRFQDGYILPPQAPGLGVRLTEDIKNRFPFVPNSGEWNVVPGGKGVPL